MKKQSMHCILGYMIYFPVVTVYQKNSVFQLYLHKLFWKPLLFSTYIQGLAINIYSYIYTYIWQYVLAKLPVGTSPSWFFYYPILLQQEKEASTFFFYIYKAIWIFMNEIDEHIQAMTITIFNTTLSNGKTHFYWWMPQETLSRPVLSFTTRETKKQFTDKITVSKEMKQLMPTGVWWLMLTLDRTQRGLATVHCNWLFLCWQKCKQ